MLVSSLRPWSLVLLAAWGAQAWAGTPKASSELKDPDGTKHPAADAFDGLLGTGWAEGADGTGDGSWIEVPFDRPIEVKSVSIWPGNLKQGRRSLREYGRPRTLLVALKTTDNQEITKEIRLEDGGLERVGPQRVDIPVQANAKSLKVTVIDSFEGGVYTDVYISEIAVNFDQGAAPTVVEKLREYESSPIGQKAKDKNYDEVLALFTKIKSEQFGDSASLEQIMDRAGDGAPHLRSQLNRVPVGFRVQALPPDATAIDALQKLEDPNAIPAFEMAALRSTGKEQRKFQLQIEYFYALQELVGGGDRNIPVWGKSGWEPGALRGFGEPISLEADVFGELYVADVGNHRIQRFDREGRQNRIWGGEPAIANLWFQATRKYHVSGAPPAEKPGQFVNPVGIDIIPGKEADGFAVLDAKGRVQVFDEEGKPVIGWSVRSDDPIAPNVGGEGYIKYHKGKLIVVWGNEIFLYAMNSEELQTWKTQDGVPNAVEVLKNGKLILVFGDEGIMYSQDGFRHGTILRASDLGPGVEDWDVTVDEKKKVWVVTDTGLLAKYKKPGKVEYVLPISEIDLLRPRIAVFDGLAYVLERDRILKFDALELRKKQLLAEEEAAAGEGG